MSKIRECEELIVYPAPRGGYTVSYPCGRLTRNTSARCQVHRPRDVAKSPGYAPHLAPVTEEQLCGAS